MFFIVHVFYRLLKLAIYLYTLQLARCIASQFETDLLFTYLISFSFGPPG